jgi:creatinine amidohydrolase
MTVSRRVVILGGLTIAAAWSLLLAFGPNCPLCKVSPVQLLPTETTLNLDEPNPLPLSPTIELEKMTWMEVRDRIATGYSRVIVPTGGIEQNGPFVALNKHDLIAKAVSVRVASILGNTLVAPVVSFVPEGGFNPPSGHMRYPGTISLSSDTFQRMLQDIVTSLSLSGFKEIVLVGDSKDSQEDIVRVATQRTPENTNGATVRYLSEFYNYDDVRSFLRERGISETPEHFHEELAFSLQLLALDPSAARYDERMAAGARSLGGVSLADKGALVALGSDILQRRAERISAAINSK